MFHPNHDDDSTDGEGDPRTLSILYATETGNAQDVSERIAHLARRLHFEVQVASLDEYEADSLFSTNTVIFVISTSGSGREPRSMTAFWSSLLRADLPSDLFDHLLFAVFGLGDAAYEKFCWPAKLLERRLLSLGATRLVERGDADDQHQLGIDGTLDPWLVELSKELLATFPLSPGTEILPEGKPPPRVSIGQACEASDHVEDKNLSTIITDGYTLTTLARNDRITAKDWYQDVRHLEFDFDHDIMYNPGDIVVIHPLVPDSDVDSFLISMDWANVADDPFTVTHILPEQSLPPQMPLTVTLRLLFTKFLDINAVPRKSFFALLRHFTTDEMERDKLDEFIVGPDAADDLYDYCTSVRRTIREVLEEFRSADIPREYLFDLFPALRPREFSIASSIRCHPRKVQLCVAIVNYRTKLRIPRRGVATAYLASLQPGARVELLIKKGFFDLPQDLDTPVVCVGPGTGIAPARAIVEERMALGANAGDTVLYQGCRSAAKDRHYGEEFDAFAGSSAVAPACVSSDSGGIRGRDLTDKQEKIRSHGTSGQPKLTYRVACSRDGPPGVPRTYVQDLIRKDDEMLWDALGHRNGVVYISGSSNKMPAGVRAALQEVAMSHGDMTQEQAKEWVGRLERERRLIEDCWA